MSTVHFVYGFVLVSMGVRGEEFLLLLKNLRRQYQITRSLLSPYNKLYLDLLERQLETVLERQWRTILVFQLQCLVAVFGVH